MNAAAEILTAAFPNASIEVDGVAAFAKVSGKTYRVAVYPTGFISAARGPHGLFLSENTSDCAAVALLRDSRRAKAGQGIDFPTTLYAD